MALPLAWAAAVVLAAVTGVAMAMVALRLREDYLAIVTLGFAEVLRLFLLERDVAHQAGQRHHRHSAPVRMPVSGAITTSSISAVVLAAAGLRLRALRARRGLALRPRAPRHP